MIATAKKDRIAYSMMEGIAGSQDRAAVEAEFAERARRRARFAAECAALEDEADALEDESRYPRAVQTKAERAASEKARRPRLLFPTLKGYRPSDLPHDILVGIVVAALSLPISMGYAQIAGLPPVYGLYGAVIPFIVFAALSTSRQLVFGVDAAPAALVASAVVGAGLVVGTDDGMRIVPWMTLFTAGFLVLFWAVRAGKFVNYISAPVMGGFVSGIAVSVIFSQLPKLMGGQPSGGEMTEHVIALMETIASGPNLIALAFGVATIVIIQLSKRFIPKVPMPIFVMLGAGALTYFGLLDGTGVALLGAVEPGLPMPHIPELPDPATLLKALTGSFTIALIVAAESLLIDNTFSMKGAYRIDDNRELLAFGLSNVASFTMGSVPVSGSASRTAVSEQFGGRTQLSSVIAALLIAAVLMWGTDFLAYLPVPVMTGIVVCALWGVVEVGFARRLFSAQRSEFWIFAVAFCGVLLFGPIQGVLVGLGLSFVAILLRTMNPYRAYMGVVPGKVGLYDLARTPDARPLPFTVVYRFSGNMFFANARTAADDIEYAVNESTRVVVLDVVGMNNCDITAADRLTSLLGELARRGIRLYLVGLAGRVEDQLRAFGVPDLRSEGILQNTVAEALHDAYERGYAAHDASLRVGAGDPAHPDAPDGVKRDDAPEDGSTRGCPVLPPTR